MAGYRDALGVFHPLRSGMEQRATRGGGKRLVESKVPYNEFLSGDFDDPETKRKKREQYDDMKRRAGYAELERETKKKKTSSGTQKRLSLAQFVRRSGGIAPHKNDMFKGELARLGRKESGTTGLINQHNKQGRQRFGAEYMMDAANEAGFRDAKGYEFSNIGDFLHAVELDARKTSGKGRKGTRRKTKAQKLAESMKENPSAMKRNAATQRSFFDSESVARARPVERLQRVRDIHKGEKGTVVKKFKDGWVSIKLDNGGHWLASPDVIERINPAGKNRVVIVNGLFGAIRRVAQRRRSTRKATRAYRKELTLESKLEGARKRRQQAEQSVHARIARQDEKRENDRKRKEWAREEKRESARQAAEERKAAREQEREIAAHKKREAEIARRERESMRRNPPTNAFTKLVDRAAVLLRKNNDPETVKAQLEKTGERPQRVARAVRAAMSQRAAAPARNPAKRAARKQNSAPPKPTKKTLENFHEFQGREATHLLKVDASHMMPKASVNGELVAIKLKGGKELRAPADSHLLADARKRLWISGKLGKPNFKLRKDDCTLEGDIEYIVYRTIKEHLGDKAPVSYIHHLGEDTGAHPRLYLDRNGYGVVRGGDYTQDWRGVIN